MFATHRIAERSSALTERVAAQLHRYVIPLTAILLAALVAASLQPFSIDQLIWRRHGLAALAQIGWPPSDAKDVAVNFAAYLPVGLLVCACLRRRNRAAAAIIGAVIFAAALSTSVEAIQTLIHTRYASWIDVIVNASGALAGAMLAARISLPARAKPIAERRSR